MYVLVSNGTIVPTNGAYKSYLTLDMDRLDDCSGRVDEILTRVFEFEA